MIIECVSESQLVKEHMQNRYPQESGLLLYNLCYDETGE